MAKLSSLNAIRPGVSAAVVGALSITSSLSLIRFGERDQLEPVPDAIARDWLAEWAITSGMMLLSAAALGGLFAVGARAAWRTVLGCALASGPIVGVSVFLTFAVMGQFEPGSPSCGMGEQSCNIALGLGAGLSSVVAGVGLGAAFLFTHSLRRAASPALGGR